MSAVNLVRRAWREIKKNYALSRTLIAWGLPGYGSVPRVFGNAMPKSGSHLLLQVLQGLCRVAPFAYVEADPLRVMTRQGQRRSSQAVLADLNRLRRGVIGWGYLPAAPEFREVLLRPGWVAFFMLRDPRDVLISQVYYATEMNENHRLRDYYRSLPDFEARLSAAIRGVNQDSARLPDIRTRYDRFLGWLDCPSVCVIKFEEMIADRQGQIQRILDRLEAAGCQLLRPRRLALQKVVEAIQPQKSPTFRKGRSGEWQSLFTAEHKRLFKQVSGDLLIVLGYEQNDDW